MVVAAQHEVHALVCHQLLEARVHIVLNVGVGGVLGHRLGGLVVGDNDPVVLAGVIRLGCVDGFAEVGHDTNGFIFCFSADHHVRVVFPLQGIVAAGIGAGVQSDKQDVVVEVIVVAPGLHLPAFSKIVIAISVWRYAVGVFIRFNFICGCLNIVAVALTGAAVLSPEGSLDLLQILHLIGQVEVVGEHIVSVVVAHGGSIGDGTHFLRCKEGLVLAGFAPVLVLHLVAGGHHQGGSGVGDDLYHLGPAGLVGAIGGVPALLVGGPVLLYLGIAGKGKGKGVPGGSGVGIFLRPGLAAVVGDLIGVFGICPQAADSGLTGALVGVSVLVSVHHRGLVEITNNGIHSLIAELHAGGGGTLRGVPAQVDRALGGAGLESQAVGGEGLRFFFARLAHMRLLVLGNRLAVIHGCKISPVVIRIGKVFPADTLFLGLNGGIAALIGIGCLIICFVISLNGGQVDDRHIGGHIAGHVGAQSVLVIHQCHGQALVVELDVPVLIALRDLVVHVVGRRNGAAADQIEALRRDAVGQVQLYPGIGLAAAFAGAVLHRPAGQIHRFVRGVIQLNKAVAGITVSAAAVYLIDDDMICWLCRQCRWAKPQRHDAGQQ